VTAVVANENTIGGQRPPLQGMIIRDAVEADLPAIVDIYNAAIRGRISSAQLEEVSVEERLPWFRWHAPDSFPLWVAEID
jgi:L-amino acid N-acyltransferase YncA